MANQVTRNLDLALRRSVELLPEGAVEATGAGVRRLSFQRPCGKPHVIEGSKERCLYTAVLALTSDPCYDGYGESMDSIRQVLQLHPGAIPSRGISAHEEILLNRVAIRV